MDPKVVQLIGVDARVRRGLAIQAKLPSSAVAQKETGYASLWALVYVPARCATSALDG
jgi:hypothetical protein